MDRIIQFENTANRFCCTALSSVEAFRSGNDQQGLDDFLCCMKDLESIFEINRYLGAVKTELGGILPALHELILRIKNQDIVGITDLMEFVLYPAVKELAQNDGHEDSPSG